MHKSLLLPHRFKAIGLAILVPSFICWLLWDFELYDFPFLRTTEGTFLSNYNYSYYNYSFVQEIIFTGLAIGLLMITFAKEKIEDEYIMTLRLESLQWAVLANSTLLVLATWIFYGTNFLSVQIYNMMTVLIIFVARFHYVLYNKNSSSERNISLPPNYKKIGFAIVLICLIAFILLLTQTYDFPFLNTRHSEAFLLDNTNISWIDEILITGMTIGLVMMAFAREISEDEFIVSLRLRSLQWAVLLNYGLLLLMNWVYFEADFGNLLNYTMFTVLIIFVLWFNISLRRTSSSLVPE